MRANLIDGKLIIHTIPASFQYLQSLEIESRMSKDDFIAMQEMLQDIDHKEKINDLFGGCKYWNDNLINSVLAFIEMLISPFDSLDYYMVEFTCDHSSLSQEWSERGWRY